MWKRNECRRLHAGTVLYSTVCSTFNNISLTINIPSNTQTAAVERKRARSVGDPPQTSKREFLGHGKPRGRQGGRRQATGYI